MQDIGDYTTWGRGRTFAGSRASPPCGNCASDRRHLDCGPLDHQFRNSKLTNSLTIANLRASYLHSRSVEQGRSNSIRAIPNLVTCAAGPSPPLRFGSGFRLRAQTPARGLKFESLGGSHILAGLSRPAKASPLKQGCYSNKMCFVVIGTKPHNGHVLFH